MLTSDLILSAIGEHPDPETGRPIGKMGQIGEIQITGDNDVTVPVAITSHSRPVADELADALETKIVAKAPNTKVSIEFTDHPRPPARLGQSALRVRSVVAVGSGKGGVGKSTVAASIALTLRRMGAKVGLMDSDVYGPSIPHLLGLTGRPAVNDNKKIVPITLDDQHGEPMPVMSMGFLVEPDQAVIWRGPMLHGSINQFLGDTQWGELDYLIIDMPPGTGDVALTLSQALPLAGAVVVCTPQEVALLDAVKAISMFHKVEIPILGMVENMSGFRCPDCSKTYDIFGRGGAREKAESSNVAFLGELPIDIVLREAGDEGRLADVINTDKTARAPFDAVARSLVRNLAANAAKGNKKVSLPML